MKQLQPVPGADRVLPAGHRLLPDRDGPPPLLQDPLQALTRRLHGAIHVLLLLLLLLLHPWPTPWCHPCFLLKYLQQLIFFNVLLKPKYSSGNKAELCFSMKKIQFILALRETLCFRRFTSVTRGGPT